MFQFLQWTAVREHSDMHLYQTCNVNRNLPVVCGPHLRWSSSSFCHTHSYSDAVTLRWNSSAVFETISHLKGIKVPQSMESFAANTICGGHSWTSVTVTVLSQWSPFIIWFLTLSTVWSYFSEIGSVLVIVHYRQNFPFVIFLNHSATISTSGYSENIDQLVNGLTYCFNWQPLRISRGICLCVFCFLSLEDISRQSILSLCQFLMLPDNVPRWSTA